MGHAKPLEFEVKLVWSFQIALFGGEKAKLNDRERRKIKDCIHSALGRGTQSQTCAGGAGWGGSEQHLLRE